MKALTIRQPWAWLIVYGGKDIENRSWTSPFRGEFYVHAAKALWGTSEERDRVRNWVREQFSIEVPADEHLLTGGIIGQVSIVDLVDKPVTPTPWFMGPYGFVLRDARPLPFRECKGRLGFFEL